MRYFILLCFITSTVAAQPAGVADWKTVLSEGRTSPRFTELLNAFAAVETDLANEARIAGIQKQIQQLEPLLAATHARQAEIAEALAAGVVRFSAEQLAMRRDASMFELRLAVKRLRYLVQLTAWVQSGGANEPTFSMEELENSPPQQTWGEIHQILARIRELQHQLVNPNQLSTAEREDVLGALSEEQHSLESRSLILRASLDLLRDHLRKAMDEPHRAPADVRVAIQANRDAIEILIGLAR